MTDRELMQQALDALCTCTHSQKVAITALRARLSQPEEPDWSAAGFTKPPKRSEEWWKHEVSNAWAEGYLKGQASVKNLLEEYEQTFVDAFVQKLNSK